MCLGGRQHGRMWTPLMVGWYWTNLSSICTLIPAQLSVTDSWAEAWNKLKQWVHNCFVCVLQRRAQNVSTRRHTLCRCRQDQQTNPWPSSLSVLMQSAAIDGKSNNDDANHLSPSPPLPLSQTIPPPPLPFTFHRPYPPLVTVHLWLSLVGSFSMTQVYLLSSTKRKNHRHHLLVKSWETIDNTTVAYISSSLILRALCHTLWGYSFPSCVRCLHCAAKLARMGL